MLIRRCFRACLASALQLVAMASFCLLVDPAVAQTCITWTQLAPGTTPLPRHSHGLVFDQLRGLGVLYGGSSASTPYMSDTWEWDGATWTQRNVSGPGARVGYAMAYDAGRGRTVLFGGFSGSALLGDTWEWDGDTWTLRSSSGPSARDFVAMCFDSVRNVCVLFGGSSASGAAGDTWEWNGTIWTQRSSGGPPARFNHAMAFDPQRQRTLLFGGNKGDGSRLGDTWEWDGSAWSLRTMAGPSARSKTSMAFDAQLGRVVLFGGDDTASEADTWNWDGNTWLQITASGPAGRNAHALTFDTVHQRLVLFGGINGGGFLGDTWGLDKLTPPSVGESPQPSTVCAGDAVVFSVAAGGSPPLTYQWRRNNVSLADDDRIVGATSSTLYINPSQIGDGGNYDVVVSNGCGPVASAGAQLAVEAPTGIANGPTSQSACVGTSVIFSVTANGTGPFTYQWRKDGNPISGATNNAVLVGPLKPADAGGYDVVVSGGCGSLTSASAVLTVRQIVGDLNYDGGVNLADLSILLSGYGHSSGVSYEQGDINGDGAVDLVDLALMLSAYGAVCH